MEHIFKNFGTITTAITPPTGSHPTTTTPTNSNHSQPDYALIGTVAGLSVLGTTSLLLCCYYKFRRITKTTIQTKTITRTIEPLKPEDLEASLEPIEQNTSIGLGSYQNSEGQTVLIHKPKIVKEVIKVEEVRETTQLMNLTKKLTKEQYTRERLEDIFKTVILKGKEIVKIKDFNSLNSDELFNLNETLINGMLKKCLEVMPFAEEKKRLVDAFQLIEFAIARINLINHDILIRREADPVRLSKYVVDAIECFKELSILTEAIKKNDTFGLNEESEGKKIDKFQMLFFRVWNNLEAVKNHLASKFVKSTLEDSQEIQEFNIELKK